MHKQSMQKRLFRLFSAFSLLSLLIVAVAACMVSYHHVMEMAVTTSEQIVEKTADEVDNLLKDMATMPSIISRASGVQAIMRKQYAQYKDQFSDRFELDAYLAGLNQYNNNIFAMYFFADNGLAAKSKYYSFQEESVIDNEFVSQAKNSGNTIWLSPSNGSHFAVTTGERVLTTITPVKELGSGEFRGVTVIELEEEKIRSFLNTRVSESGFLYIRDNAGQPILWPDGMTEQQVTDHLSQQKGRMVTRGPFRDLQIEQLLNNGSDWAVICTIPGAELGQNIINIIKIVCIISIVVLVIAIWAAYYCAKKLVHPIVTLDEKMQQVERGNLNAYAPVGRPDEIGALTEQFNLMIATIRNLMEREVENEKQLRLTELKALQAQIKPHFLYNTLDSIMWLVRANDQKGAVLMVMALTRFLKIGLSRGSEIIPLQDELKHAESYLVIQNIRYKDQFTHEIKMEAGLETCPVPKLILQPLIENAIYHGMKLKRGTSHLDVRAYEMNGSLHIDVEDNGAGMTPERIEALRNMLQKRGGLRAESYGVRNVHERITILFGEEYGVTFESKQGEGSCFHIRLPFQPREDDGNESTAGG